jgi:hypothetical protein
VTHEIDRLNRAAQQAAATIVKPARVIFVACSYDTSFEPVDVQVKGRIEQLIETFGVDGPVIWSLWIVDDLPRERGFSAAVENAYGSYPSLVHQGRLFVRKMTGVMPEQAGLKGRALIEGMSMALDETDSPDAVVYLNLNLKVDAGLTATGVSMVLAGECGAAIGSRARADGGVVVGAGRAGRLKSRAYSRLARSLLPPLDGFEDTNAPVKVFSADAARRLVRMAVIEHVTLDCEWLMIMKAGGVTMRRFPIAWIQRPGSRPPWHLIPMSIRDLVRIRRRWLAGALATD